MIFPSPNGDYFFNSDWNTARETHAIGFPSPGGEYFFNVFDKDEQNAASKFMFPSPSGEYFFNLHS